MNAQQKRNRCLAAVRGQMRHMEIEPKHQSFPGVLRVLDDFLRTGHEAGLWYENASSNQMRLLKRDWRRWRHIACGNQEKVWVAVKEAIFCCAAGNSIFNANLPLGNEWELILEDGRIVNRPVRYTPQVGYVLRGWYHRRRAGDALPAPKRVLVIPKRNYEEGG